VNALDRKRYEKAAAKRNAEILAEHKALRSRILALRPAWNAATLESIQQSYGTTADGLPGLRVLLDAIEQHDAIAARFGGAS